jgi:two-component system, cell cycle sensor histidine kinase and response regulator CckA
VKERYQVPDALARQLAVLRIAGRAAAGASPQEVAAEAEVALAPLAGVEAARAIGAQLARAAAAPDDEDAAADEPFLRETITLVRGAARQCLAARTDLERYRTLLEHSSDGIYVVDPEGRYLEVNARGAEMLGYTRDELLRMRIYDLVVPTDPPVDMPAVRRGAIVRRRSLRRKDGSLMTAEIGAQMLPDGGLFSIVRDVTERDRAERELHGRAERFHHALRAARAGAWEWNVLTNAAFWSEETYLLMGMEPGDGHIDYRTWLQSVHPEDRASAETVVARAVRDRADLACEYRVVRADGQVRWIRDVGKTVCDDHGEPIAMYGIMIDITDGKETELARMEAEARLQQTQRMEAIGRLAGGIAHDFNNLLTVILTASHVVGEGLPAADPSRVHAMAIREAAERGAALTRQLLALSRHQPVAPAQVDLDAQVRRIGPMLQRLLGATIEIESSLHGGLPLIRIDPGQLDQVLLNLAINARDAMPSGGRLTFATEVEGVGDGASVVLVVSDNGIGMDEATRARAFEPFFTTKPADSGTGLGLATVYGIVVQNGGGIEVESAPGGGSRFRLRLPVSVEPDEVELAPRRPPARAGGGARVLVVEDERSVRRLVVSILESSGHQVLAAASGAEALAIIEDAHEPLDLLVTDVVLPDLSGPQVAEQLRSHDPRARVLLMSGYPGDLLDGQGVDIAAPLLQKPFTPAMLLEAVQRALG